ncbi:RHS repeat-associated protein [Catenulispora sp. EB89]|uniref:RHS repeat domain-containing protein n=1 Tax=Catenulispora sp. EB89 TaxID=3156257 RepID=UPI0035180523
MLSIRQKGRRLSRGLAVGTVAVALVATLGGPQAAWAAKAKPVPHAPPSPAEKQIPHALAVPGKSAPAKAFAKYDPGVASTLPGAGTATVDLTTDPSTPAGAAAAAATGMTAARVAAVAKTTGGTVHPAGSLPISIIAAAPAAVRSAATVAAGTSASATSPVLSKVTVSLADQQTAQAAGIHGVLFGLAPADVNSGSGRATVSVDDSSFKAAFGGDYGARLHLVELPGCALTTPQLAQCEQQTPLAPVGGDALTAVVTVGQSTGGNRSAAMADAASTGSHMVVLAATSSPDGSAGTYSASTLSPAGTWAAGGNTGGFTYSYPIQVPAAIAGGTPTVSLSYDSSSQDGRTAGTNNQSSWLGDGWSSADSYIERSYKSCSDDSGSGAPQYSGDQCWAGQDLTLSLNGQSTEIVYDDTTKTFHAQADSAFEKIEQLTDCTNGTYNNECWRVTEDGVQYYFGLNHLPGYTGAAGQATQSAWTVPVYGAHSGDPCNASTFAASSCLQGWRWNLDYTVDLHNNATAYYYQPETNYYGADMKNTAVQYTRGGYLTRIDYGITASTVYSGTAPEQIVFGTDERCISGTPSGNTCADSQFTTANAAYWPDVPIDLNCASGSNCTNHGPSFWSRKRLTSITTQIQVAGKTQQIDKYAFSQSFPDGGDHAPTLWLDSIQRTGLDTSGGGTGSVTNPATSFDPPLQLANRVGTIANLPVMYHDRIQDISTETGAQITVAYNPATCTPSTVPTDPSTNTASCYPVYWTPQGSPNPELDWFQKYTVHSVLTQDLHNANQDGTYPELLTTYAYDGGAAWHYDDNEIVKAANRTYGQFRGYQTVETRTGDPAVFHMTNGAKVNDQLTLTKTTYFRGMDSDTPSGSGGTAVSLTSQDTKHTVKDSNALAGQIFEKDTYTADGGTLDTASVTLPVVIGPTASRARTGLPPLTAQMVHSGNVYTSEAVSYGQRNTESDVFYNTTLGQATTGMPIQSDDRGEPGAAGNVARCTWTRYVENTAETLVLPAESITTAQDCSSAGATPSGTLISDTRTSYDGNAFTWDGASGGTAPTKGEATTSEQASASANGVATAYLVAARTSYDGYGRTHVVTRTPNSTAPGGASLAQTTTTTYTPATGALPTTVSTQTQVTAGTTPTYQTVTTTMDAGRALPVEKIDAAGLKTDLTYDPMGRLTAVWEPNESKAASQSANLTYSYAMSNTGPTVITTNKLLDNGTYAASETLYDAMDRVRQTQSAGENNTTTVVDTQYDSHGWTVLTNNGYSVSGAPAAALISVAQNSLPDTTITDHDGMGRADLVSNEHDGATPAGATTTTVYTGDTTTTVPRTGGVVTRSVTDARGQQTELDQYTTAPTVAGSAAAGYTATGGTPSATKYTYTPDGKQSGITGPDGSAWSFAYDQLGRKTQQSDPDAGTVKYGYDDAGDLVSSTDARGIELDYTYDLLDRKLTETDKHLGGFQVAGWVYDTLQVGKLTSSTSYVQGVTGDYTIAATGYTSLGRSTGTKVTLPASEAPLPTSYTTSFSYSTNDQALTGQVDPRTMGMAGENITYGRDALGNPTSTTSSAGTYVSGTVYTDYAEPSQVTYGPSTNPAWATYTYDDQTRRLTDLLVSRTQAPGPAVDDTSYTYDESGNPLSETDKQSETGQTVTDTQCFTYDALDRLTQAWTAAGTCPAEGTNPTSATVASGTGAYWQTYGYDAISNRTSETDHAVNGATADTTTGYTDSCTGTAAQCPNGTQPHTLTKTSTTGPAGSGSTAFGYDALGDLTSRTPSTGAAQSLVWDDEGRLSSATQGTSVTKYVYDADGNELLRRDPGQTTLFAGDTQIVVNTSVTPNVLLGAIRTYTTGGTPGTAVAIRSSLPGGGLDYLFTDPHDTATLLIDATTQAASRKEYTPFGQLRATTGATWIDPSRGFLGKAVATATGYTDVGARKYDPVLGRFISADPVLETASPQQLGGYAYCGDNPVTNSDPSGLMLMMDGGGGGGGGGSTSSSSSGDGSETDEPTTYDDPGSSSEPWYKIWSPRHDTAVGMAQEWLQAQNPNDTVDVNVRIDGGSAKGNGNVGWADIVEWGPDKVQVWEVKNGGGAAEAAGPAQLDRYMQQLAEMMDAHGDHRAVVTGGDIPELGPKPNIGNPSELITCRSSSTEPGIITYSTTKLKPGDPVPDPVPVPVPNPAPAPAGQKVNRPSWVTVKPLWSPTPGLVPQAPAPGSTGNGFQVTPNEQEGVVAGGAVAAGGVTIWELLGALGVIALA